jgi:protein-disulfide isomerase/uncharacterized membrane protein
MSAANRKISALVVALIGAVVSLLLLMEHYHQEYAASLIASVCGGAHTGGCVAVNLSSYSVLGGVPVAAFGIFFYLSVALVVSISLLTEKTLLHTLCRIVFFLLCVGFLVDLALGAVQFFAIGQFCVLCLSTYVITFILLWLFLPYRSSKDGMSFNEIRGTREGKLVLASGGVGILMIALLVLAYNYGLAGDDPVQLQDRLTQMAYAQFEQSEVQTIDVAGLPTIGSTNAPIKVVIMSDFLCPWCRQLAQDIQQHLAQWQSEVAFYYVNYPLDPTCNPYEKDNVHPGACWAAQGGVCADDQKKFWEYHDMMFSKGFNRTLPGDILKVAVDLSLDTTAFKDCFVNPSLRHKLVLQMRLAHDLGTSTTPRIYINGRLLSKISDFNVVLGREAQKLGLPTLPGTTD